MLSSAVIKFYISFLGAIDEGLLFIGVASIWGEAPNSVTNAFSSMQIGRKDGLRLTACNSKRLLFEMLLNISESGYQIILCRTWALLASNSNNSSYLSSTKTP